MNEAASAETEPAMKAELEEAVATDADLLKVEQDVTVVTKAEPARAEAATAEAEPADAELDEAETAVAGLSAKLKSEEAEIAGVERTESKRKARLAEAG